VVARDHLEVLAEAVPAHRPLVATAPAGRDGSATAVDIGDATVAEAGEVVDRLRDALVVGGANDVDPVGADGTADHDHREPAVERGEARGRRFGAQQHEGLAAGVEQRLDRPRLVPGPRDGTEHEVVPGQLRGRVDVLDELGVEGVPDVHHHADETAPAAGQEAGGPVRPVAESCGRLQDTLAGGLARSRNTAQHERHRRRRHSDRGGDVRQPRTTARLPLALILCAQDQTPRSLDTTPGAHSMVFPVKAL